MSHNVETMAYTNQVPWHGLGEALKNAPTVEGMLKAAKIDWTVSKRPLSACFHEDRVNGKVGAKESPMGWMPHFRDIEWKGLESVTAAQFDELMSIDTGTWKQELESHGELFEQLKARLPRQLVLKRGP